MTDRELAGCALSEVMALLEKATPGEWRWSMNGNIVPQEYTQDCEIAAVYTEHDELNTEPANSAAICASVNFLRQHGPALLAALSTPSREGDGRDGERYRRWRLLAASGTMSEAVCEMMIAARTEDDIDAAIDAAIAAAAGGS